MKRRRWIRLDVTWDDSSWLARTDGNARRLWPPFLCYVKVRGVRGQTKRLDYEVLARRLDADVVDVDALLTAALKDGAVQIVAEGNDWLVTNWEEYQEPDRTNATRQARHREKHRIANSLRVVNGDA